MKKLKILLDYSPACKSEKTGIPFFVAQLYNHLSYDQTIMLHKTQCLSKYIPTKPWKVFRFFEKILYQKIYIPFKLKFGNYDVYIVSEYMFSPLFKPKNTLIVNLVYDIGINLLDTIRPYSYTKNWRQNFKCSMEYTDIIATLSQSSKDDITKYLKQTYNITRPTAVIYAGASNSNVEKVTNSNILKKYTKPNDYFLFLGTLEPRKNPLNLVKAFRLYKTTTQADTKLVFAGKLGWMYDDIIDYIQQHNLHEEIIFTGYVIEEEKNYLLQHTKGLLFLSLYEGFGMPVLEALQQNIPTLVSDIPVFRELYGSNVLYANPMNVQDIAKQFKVLLATPASIVSDSISHYNWATVSTRLVSFIKTHST